MACRAEHNGNFQAGRNLGSVLTPIHDPISSGRLETWIDGLAGGLYRPSAKSRLKPKPQVVFWLSSSIELVQPKPCYLLLLGG